MFTIQNPSFEESDVGWQVLGDGFVYTSATASDGVQSVKVTNGGARSIMIFPAG